MADGSAVSFSRAPLKAGPPPLRPSMGSEEALKAIVASCLAHYRANEGQLLASGDGEALHQSRVALRRMRSALSLIAPLLPPDRKMKKRRKALKRLAQAFGAVRELDVVAGRCDPAGRAALSGHREEAFERLARRLGRRKTRRLLDKLSDWSATPSAGDSRQWAAALLDQRLDRVRRKGAGLCVVSAKKRHKLRIELKKLRYGAEFFEQLYASDKARRRSKSFLETLPSLQDVLGELNDLATAPRLLATYGVSARVAKRRKLQARLLGRAEKDWAILMAAKPFWRCR